MFLGKFCVPEKSIMPYYNALSFLVYDFKGWCQSVVDLQWGCAPPPQISICGCWWGAGGCNFSSYTHLKQKSSCSEPKIIIFRTKNLDFCSNIVLFRQKTVSSNSISIWGVQHFKLYSFEAKITVFRTKNLDFCSNIVLFRQKTVSINSITIWGVLGGDSVFQVTLI